MVEGSLLLQIGEAVLAGSTLPVTMGFLWRRLRRDRKADAETRKLNVQADDMIVARLYAEIDRLDHDVSDLRKQLAEERRECDRRIAGMEGRIRQMQQRQTSAGRMTKNQVEGPLRAAFPVPSGPDPDSDLIGKLDQ